MPPLRRTTLGLTLACCLGLVLTACGGSGSADATPHPVVWDRATVMSPTSLRVDWTGSACEELVDATAVESSTSVTVTVRERATTAEQRCSAVGRLATATVELATPLGTRTVLGCGRAGCLAPPPAPTVT